MRDAATAAGDRGMNVGGVAVMGVSCCLVFGVIFEPSASVMSLGIMIDPGVGLESVVYKCVGEVEAALGEVVAVGKVCVDNVESFALERNESGFFLPPSNLEKSALSGSAAVNAALAGGAVSVVGIVTRVTTKASSETVFAGAILSPDPVSKTAAPVVSTADSTLTNVASRSPSGKYLSSSPKRYWPTTDPLDSKDGKSSGLESPVPSPPSLKSLLPWASLLSAAARPRNSAADKILRSLLKFLSGDLTSTPSLPPPSSGPPRTWDSTMP